MGCEDSVRCRLSRGSGYGEHADIEYTIFRSVSVFELEVACRALEIFSDTVTVWEMGVSQHSTLCGPRIFYLRCGARGNLELQNFQRFHNLGLVGNARRQDQDEDGGRVVPCNVHVHGTACPVPYIHTTG